MTTGKQDALWLLRTIDPRARSRVGELEVRELWRVVRSVLIPAGRTLYKKNQPLSGMWILRSGCIEIYEGRGRDRHVVGLVKPGQVLGDVYLILDELPPLNARTVEETQALFIAADDFKHLVSAYPNLCVAWLATFAARLSETRGRVLDILPRDLHERLARLLIQESVDHEIRLPQETIGAMLGVRRPSINKVLKEFERQGLAELGYRRILLKDLQGLQRVARGNLR